MWNYLCISNLCLHVRCIFQMLVPILCTSTNIKNFTLFFFFFNNVVNYMGHGCACYFHLQILPCVFMQYLEIFSYLFLS